MKFIVDRFEGDYALLEDENRNVTAVPRLLLDDSIKEGAHVLYDGERYITNAELAVEEEKAREIIKTKFERLKKK